MNIYQRLLKTNLPNDKQNIAIKKILERGDAGNINEGGNSILKGLEFMENWCYLILHEEDLNHYSYKIASELAQLAYEELELKKI